MQKNSSPIGVFDSGVGGLSVLIELKKKLPNENFVFLADQLNVPYGEKSKEELVGFMHKVVNYFVKKHKIKLLVIACNTATCHTIDELRKEYSFPIVGTVPAVKSAAMGTETGTIAVISTPSTSASEVLKNLIIEHCVGVKVFNIGCKYLENAVEVGDLNSVEVKYLLSQYLKDVKNSTADRVVLGCTHYPFLRRTIQKIVGRNVKLVDSGEAIARHTQSVLLNHKIVNNQNKKGKSVYFTTGNSAQFSKVASKLLKNRVRGQKAKI